MTGLNHTSGNFDSMCLQVLLLQCECDKIEVIFFGVAVVDIYFLHWVKSYTRNRITLYFCSEQTDWSYHLSLNDYKYGASFKNMMTWRLERMYEQEKVSFLVLPTGMQDHTAVVTCLSKYGLLRLLFAMPLHYIQIHMIRVLSKYWHP